MNSVTCPHCGRELALASQAPHMRKCAYGAIRDTLISYMRRYAVNGVGLATEDYTQCAERKALALPGVDTLSDQFGTWQAFVEWCGLKFGRQYSANRRPRQLPEHVILSQVDAELHRARRAEKDAFDWSAMPAIDRGVKAVFDWRTMSYRECHVMELR